MEQDVNLNDVPVEEADLPFTDSVERELRKMFDGDKAVCFLCGDLLCCAGDDVRRSIGEIPVARTGWHYLRFGWREG